MARTVSYPFGIWNWEFGRVDAGASRRSGRLTPFTPKTYLPAQRPLKEGSLRRRRVEGRGERGGSPLRRASHARAKGDRMRSIRPRGLAEVP